MKRIICIWTCCQIITCLSCVQKTTRHHVRLILDVSQVKDVKSVAVRGSEYPLSWEKDIEMTPMVTDSLYQADITIVTGYLGTELKFLINGQYELQNQDNRRVTFNKQNDTTVYQAIFDKRNTE